jgi:hypothetical protein
MSINRRRNLSEYLLITKFTNQHSKMIKVILNDTRFSVEAQYHTGMVNMFRTIEKRFWDVATKQWSFRNTDLAMVCGWFDKNKLQFELIDARAPAHVVVHADKTEIMVSKTFGFLSRLQSIDGCSSQSHDETSTSLTIPDSAHVKEIEDIFKEANNYKYKLDNLNDEISQQEDELRSTRKRISKK